MPSVAGVTLYTIGGVVLASGVGMTGYTGLMVLSSHDVSASQRFEISGDTLTVTSDGGGVHLKPGGVAGVVDVDRKTTDSINGAEPEWSMKDGKLRLDTNCSNFINVMCDGSYDVMVPPEIKYVTVRNDNGSVTADHMKVNTFDLTSDNGSIKVRDSVAGVLKLSSDNGSISVARSAADWVDAGSDNGSLGMTLTNEPHYVKASSDNGSLKVTLPRGEARYTVTADADNGSKSVDIPSETSERILDLSSDNGSLRVRYSDVPLVPLPADVLVTPPTR